jgi:hypothetical protein
MFLGARGKLGGHLKWFEAILGPLLIDSVKKLLRDFFGAKLRSLVGVFSRRRWSLTDHRRRRAFGGAGCESDRSQNDESP